MMHTYRSTSVAQTQEIAAQIAKKMTKGGTVCLYGELGSGKTTFTKGFARELGIKEKEIKSPTYTFVRQYTLGRSALYHFDFYRVEEVDDLMEHDLEEIFGRKNTWIVIEWPDRVEGLLPKEHLKVTLKYGSEKERDITVEDGR